MLPIATKDGQIECKCKDSKKILKKHYIGRIVSDARLLWLSAPKNEPNEPVRYIDPAMIMILVAMALMFIIICVVLRLFSR